MESACARSQWGRAAILSSLSCASPARKVLVRTDVIAGRLKRPTHQFEDYIAAALPTTGKGLVLPEEHLMGWTMAEVQYLIHSRDADVFAGDAEHRNPETTFENRQGATV